MFKFLLLLFLLILPTKLSSEINNEYYDNNYFHIGKMNSYNSEFTLYFKTRKKAILAKGEFYNYINDFPQDLYLYDKNLNKDYPLISYDWFPKKVKKISKKYNYPLFPEDFAYYLLNDNNTLILVSAKKNFNEKISLATVYNTVHAFKKKGYLKEISINSDKSYFDTNILDGNDEF